MSLSCRESELKTFTTEIVVARVEYVDSKNNYFLRPELDHKKPLHYFENVAKIYETVPVLLLQNNAK